MTEEKEMTEGKSKWENKRRLRFIEKHQEWIYFLNNLEAIIAEKTATNEAGINEAGIEVMNWEDKHRGYFDFINMWRPDLLMRAVYAFMYENLKAISRKERNCLRKIDNADDRLVFCFLDELPEYRIIEKSTKHFENAQIKHETIILYLARMLDSFLDYVHEAIEDKAEYRIAVCCFQRRKESECGKVFIGGKITSESCPEHERKWSRIKADRKRRGK